MKEKRATQLIPKNPQSLPLLGVTLSLLMAGLVAPLHGQLPSAQNYAIATIDPPVVNFDIQFIWVNNSGLISLQYQSPVGAPFPQDLHAAVLENGVWRVVDLPGSAWSGDTNPNSRGQLIVGTIDDNGAFDFEILENGTYTPLPEIPGFVYGANGFNDRGQIAGNAFYPDGSIHGFVGNSRAYEVFDYPTDGFVITIPAMINSGGMVVGEYDVVFSPFSTTVHAFLKEGDNYTNLDLPGTEATSALFINNPGVVVGYYLLDGNRHGFIRSKKGWTGFDVPGAIQTWISSINDHGQLTGGYQDSKGQTHGFLATPRHGSK